MFQLFPYLISAGMYTGIKHTHVLVVTLFLLLYLFKGGLLLMGKNEQLDNFTKRFRIPEMILSVLFLFTGGFLLLNSAVTTLLIAKIVVVFASIPIAVVGFKKKKKVLGVLSVVLLIAAYGMAEMDKVGVERATIAASAQPTVQGKAIYEANCIICHGADGKMGLNGAKDITATELTDAELLNLLQNGKNSMPPYKAIYNEKELGSVIAYIKTL